jgi:hypothetical protein
VGLPAHVAIVFAGAFILLFLIVAGGWWYVGTASFADLVTPAHREDARSAPRARSDASGRVTIIRARPSK